ncbi:MAG: hypothetical protein WCC17_13450 [Candidatus Nitrosopolaris sp.]
MKTYPKAHLIIMLLKNAGDKEKMIFWYQSTILNSPNLKSAIANYYRIKRFKLDITKYLFRNDS